MFVRSIICVTMRDWTQMIFSINNKSWKGMLRMLKKSLSKSALMTALITGSVIWGALEYTLRKRSSLCWTNMLLRLRV